jgi:indolepyruvate decarboxylase
MVLIDAVVPRLDVPDLLNDLTGPTSPDGSPRR